MRNTIVIIPKTRKAIATVIPDISSVVSPSINKKNHTYCSSYKAFLIHAN